MLLGDVETEGLVDGGDVRSFQCSEDVKRRAELLVDGWGRGRAIIYC